MVLDPDAFKAYDVRAVYPTELDEVGAYAIGRAFVEQFAPRRIAVGRDMRLSSPAVARAVIEGAADGGADVVDLGMVGTEMVYYATGKLGLEGGIMVTASHNPKQYTGLKIVSVGALPVGSESGLNAVRDRALAADWRPARRGSITTEDIWEPFIAAALSFVDLDAIAPLKVVVDAANGMAGTMLPPILAHLPQVEVVRFYFEPDGTFPHHEPNPLLPENREFIVAATLAEHAAFGVAYDGDADRCFFVDDLGEFVPGDFTTALFASSMLAREPGGKVIYDVRASWAVPEAIEAAGGVALMNRVGHSFIKQRMREVDAVFAGEVSAHYYFREFSRADSGIVPFLLMLELLSKSKQSLSELLAAAALALLPERRDQHPGRRRRPGSSPKLEERFGAEGRVTHLDGLSVDAAEWHMNIRGSNTEPLLRLNLEARSQELMERKRDEVLEAIRS